MAQVSVGSIDHYIVIGTDVGQPASRSCQAKSEGETSMSGKSGQIGDTISRRADLERLTLDQEIRIQVLPPQPIPSPAVSPIRRSPS